MSSHINACTRCLC